MQIMKANETAKHEFYIPVSWRVTDKVCIQADSLDEAYGYVSEHLDDIPLGDSPDYEECSYTIDADDSEQCLCYQDLQDVVCLRFYCDDDLSQYIDSMLFDSTSVSGHSVAGGTFCYKNKMLDIYLDICGEVAVTFRDVVYHRPSEFPDDLKALIKAHPNDWDTYGTDEDNIYVGLNNWFEYIYASDGDVLEEDLSKMTKEDVLDDMMAIARQYFGINKEGK